MTVALQSFVRRGAAPDLAAVLALLREARLPTEDLTSAPGLQFWVLESEGRLIGVIGLERFGTGALLRSLAVASEHQRQGFGHQLVTRLEQDARSTGVERLVLLTETAEAFFGRLGYEPIDRGYVPDEIKESAEFRSLCPASAVCLTKTLA